MSVAVSRSSLLAWVQAVLLAANLGMTTLALGGLSAETTMATSALTWASFVLMLWRCGWANEDGAVRLHPAGWAFVPFLAYAAINVLAVTPVRWLGWRDALGWAQLIVTFWIALDVVRSSGPRRFLCAAVAGLGVATVALAAYQRFLDPHWLMLGRMQAEQFVGRASGAFGIPNSAAAFLILLIPPVLESVSRASTRVGKFATAGLAGIFGFGLVLTLSRGAWIALGIALAVWPLFRRNRALSSRLKTAGWVTVAVLGVGLALSAVVPGVRERFEILRRDSGERSRPILWRAAWELWQEAPVLGTGAGSYAVLFERHRPERFNDDPRWAHNDYLNTLSDYGAVGFALFFGASAWVGWRAVTRRNEPQRAGIPRAGFAVGLLAFGLSLGLEFHLKIPALAMLAACSAAVVVSDEGNSRGKPEARSPSQRWRLTVTGLGVVVLFFGAIWPRLRAEAWRQRARGVVDDLASRPADGVIEREKVFAAQTLLARAVAIDPDNARAWADTAYLASWRARMEPARALAGGMEAERAARGALALSAVIPEFWSTLGIALDGQGRWIEAGTAFARATEMAPHSARSWYYRAYHLSLQAGSHDEALAAVATCLRLDPGWRVAELLREQLAVSPGRVARPPP